jgi:hypothetical protein
MVTGQEWLARFAASMARLGVSYEAGTPDARRYLEQRGDAEAVTIPFPGSPFIYFRDSEPAASAVLEELAHVLQERRGRWADCDLREMVARREIEAKECLDSHGELRYIPTHERAATLTQLDLERRQLERLRNTE